MSPVFEEDMKFLMGNYIPPIGSMRFDAAANTLWQYTDQGWTPLQISMGALGIGTAIMLGGASILAGAIVNKLSSSSASTSAPVVSVTYTTDTE